MHAAVVRLARRSAVGRVAHAHDVDLALEGVCAAFGVQRGCDVALEVRLDGGVAEIFEHDFDVARGGVDG